MKAVCDRIAANQTRTVSDQDSVKKNQEISRLCRVLSIIFSDFSVSFRRPFNGFCQMKYRFTCDL
jgi:hypothetical protein